jgi:hypothetical protein
MDRRRRTDLRSGSPSEGVLRFSGVYFLSALLLLIVTGPFIDQLEYGILIESVLISIVLFSALLAIGGRRRTLILGSVLVIPALAGKWVNYFRPDLAPPEIFLGAALLFTGYVVLHLFGFILRAPRVKMEILCTAVANYLMLALVWAFGYTLIAGVNPDAFVVTYGTTAGHQMKGINSLYFACTPPSLQTSSRIKRCTDGSRDGSRRRHVLHDHADRQAGCTLFIRNPARKRRKQCCRQHQSRTMRLSGIKLRFESILGGKERGGFSCKARKEQEHGWRRGP